MRNVILCGFFLCLVSCSFGIYVNIVNGVTWPVPDGYDAYLLDSFTIIAESQYTGEFYVGLSGNYLDAIRVFYFDPDDDIFREAYNNYGYLICSNGSTWTSNNPNLKINIFTPHVSIDHLGWRDITQFGFSVPFGFNNHGTQCYDWWVGYIDNAPAGQLVQFIPEPVSLLLLCFGGLLIRKR